MDLCEKDEEDQLLEEIHQNTWYFCGEKEEIDDTDDTIDNLHQSHHFYPPNSFDISEPMDVPSVGDSKYFSFAPVRRHQHPTNPNTNGFISSRILPDGSNTFRLTTALGADFTVPPQPDIAAQWRMGSEDFQKEYSGLDKKPIVLTHGEVNTCWKE